MNEMKNEKTAIALAMLRSAVDFSKTHDVPLSAIVLNADQPRTEFDEEELFELVASIVKFGQKDTAFVLPREDGTYLMVSGERRWRALKRTSIVTIRVHFCRRELTDDETYFLSCYGNAKQVEQSTYDNVVMVRTLLAKGLIYEQIATLLSRSISWVGAHANVAANLAPPVFEMMRGSREKSDRILLDEALKILLMAPEIQETAAKFILANKKKGGGKDAQRVAFQVFVEQSGVRDSHGNAAKHTINGELLGIFTRFNRDLESFAAAPEGLLLSNLRQSGLSFLIDLLEKIDTGKKRAGSIESALRDLPLLDLGKIVAEVGQRMTALRDLVQRAYDALQEKK